MGTSNRLALILALAGNIFFGAGWIKSSSAARTDLQSMANTMVVVANNSYETGCASALRAAQRTSDADPMQPMYVQWCKNNAFLYTQNLASIVHKVRSQDK